MKPPPSPPAKPAETGTLLRQPAHPLITEEMVHELVHAFYDKIRDDHILGPIFDNAIGDAWDDHLEKMCDFWSSVVLMSGRYKGRPLPVHMRLKDVRPAHFEQWLQLFGETAEAVCPAEVAPVFIERAKRIAESFQLGMFFRLGDPGSFPTAPRGTAS